MTVRFGFLGFTAVSGESFFLRTLHPASCISCACTGHFTDHGTAKRCLYGSSTLTIEIRFPRTHRPQLAVAKESCVEIWEAPGEAEEGLALVAGIWLLLHEC